MSSKLGDAVANKIVILDGNKDYKNIRNLHLTGDLKVEGKVCCNNYCDASCENCGGLGNAGAAKAWASYNSYDTSNHGLEGHNVTSISHHSVGKTTINIASGVITDVSKTVTAGCAVAAHGYGWNPATQAVDPHLDVYGGGDSISDFGAMVMTTTTCHVKTQNQDNNDGADYGNVQVVIFGE
jgi:hypothetical protein